MPRRCDLRFVDLLSGEIRAADVRDLALADQVIERTQGFLDRCFRIGEMHLVKVDPVGLEPLQARLDGFRDVAARRTAAPGSFIGRPNLVASTTSLRRAPSVSPEKFFGAALLP